MGIDNIKSFGSKIISHIGPKPVLKFGQRVFDKLPIVGGYNTPPGIGRPRIQILEQPKNIYTGTSALK